MHHALDYLGQTSEGIVSEKIIYFIFIFIYLLFFFFNAVQTCATWLELTSLGEHPFPRDNFWVGSFHDGAVWPEGEPLSQPKPPGSLPQGRRQ